ncbi:hypothetical protein H8B06_06305 [Sphingobacterium sp. DN00404]|uniref:Uncharacterized protein n=1 Tax=Sphingobacterium micropteri TaxID=2763501 RepID=A0ABR7YM76_9SPHI|nr:hypothetical protein [Sphingobacterium micropteri]MBD1432429.1 hypothetical protein [Sphingobacterium micropteri]
METSLITKEQLDKIVERVEGEFRAYFTSEESKVNSLRDCFFKPEIYAKEKLLSLDQEIFQLLPKEIQEKTHELIAELTKVD